MTIGEMIGQGFHYARTCRSLWLFGFFVGIASGGSSGSNGGAGIANGGSDDGTGLTGLPFALSITDFPPIVLAIVGVLVVMALTAILLHYISEGALIEGIVRARHGERTTMGDGFRAGWRHWGVLLRIALLYFAAVIGSLVLLAAPCVIAVRAFGAIGGVALGIPALVIAVPWLITLHLVQAFAARIAVLENRRALDAIHKARLFLHGRIRHGLKLIVATFVGTLGMALLSIAVILPVVLLLVLLVRLMHILPVVVLGCLVLLPIGFVLIAMLGTFRSSIWTIGYVTEVEA